MISSLTSKLALLIVSTEVLLRAVADARR